ncbi:MAG: V-type ATP synthase subunit F [Candidatus Hodarchaeales archaeon]
MRITALVDSRNAIWMKLSGIKVHEYEQPEVDGRRILKTLISSNDYGIIIISPEISRKNPKIIKDAFKKLYPVILELPTSDKPSHIQDLIRSAIGVNIEL